VDYACTGLFAMMLRAGLALSGCSSPVAPGKLAGLAGPYLLAYSCGRSTGAVFLVTISGWGGGAIWSIGHSRGLWLCFCAVLGQAAGAGMRRGLIVLEQLLSQKFHA